MKWTLIIVIGWLTFSMVAQQGYTPRKEMIGKSIPEMQDPLPSPLPERSTMVSMHRRYHGTMETNDWFELLVNGHKMHVGAEKNELEIITTSEPHTAYANGKWTTKF